MKLIPANWRRHLLLLMAFLGVYFVVLPLVYGVLFFLFLWTGMVPLVLVLFVIGSATGVATIAVWYYSFILSLVVAFMNSTATYEPVLTMSCGSGYEIQIEERSTYYVAPQHLDAVLLGYSIVPEISGALRFTAPLGEEHVRLDDAEALTRGMPFMHPGDVKILLSTLGNEYHGGTGLKIRSVLGQGTGESPSGGIVRISPHIFTRDDFSVFASCIDTYEKENGLLTQAKPYLAELNGIARIEGAHTLREESMQFLCPTGLSIETAPPYFITTTEPNNTTAFPEYIGTLTDNLSTRSLSQAEFTDMGSRILYTYVTGYAATQSCLARGVHCPSSLTGYQGLTPVEVTQTSNPAWYRSLLERRYSAPFRYPGLEEGFPATYDQCRNAQGQTIKEYFSETLEVY